MALLLGDGLQQHRFQFSDVLLGQRDLGTDLVHAQLDLLQWRDWRLLVVVVKVVGFINVVSMFDDARPRLYCPQRPSWFVRLRVARLHVSSRSVCSLVIIHGVGDGGGEAPLALALAEAGSGFAVGCLGRHAAWIERRGRHANRDRSRREG